MNNPELNRQSVSSIDTPISFSDTSLNTKSINNVTRRNTKKAINILCDKGFQANYSYDYTFGDGGLQINFSYGVTPSTFSSIPSLFTPFFLYDGSFGFRIERSMIRISFDLLKQASINLLDWATKLPSAVVYSFEVNIPMGEDPEELLECFKDSIYNSDFEIEPEEDDDCAFFGDQLIFANDTVSAFEAKLNKFADENSTTVTGFRLD